MNKHITPSRLNGAENSEPIREALSRVRKLFTRSPLRQTKALESEERLAPNNYGLSKPQPSHGNGADSTLGCTTAELEPTPRLIPVNNPVLSTLFASGKFCRYACTEDVSALFPYGPSTPVSDFFARPMG